MTTVSQGSWREWGEEGKKCFKIRWFGETRNEEGREKRGKQAGDGYKKSKQQRRNKTWQSEINKKRDEMRRGVGNRRTTTWGNRNWGDDEDSIQLTAISLTARSKSKAIQSLIDVRDELGGDGGGWEKKWVRDWEGSENLTEKWTQELKQKNVRCKVTWPRAKRDANTAIALCLLLYQRMIKNVLNFWSFLFVLGNHNFQFSRQKKQLNPSQNRRRLANF